jgi:hypothetical protein
MSKCPEVLHLLPLHCYNEVTHQHHVPKAGSIQVPTQNITEHLDSLQDIGKHEQNLAPHFKILGYHYFNYS